MNVQICSHGWLDCMHKLEFNGNAVIQKCAIHEAQDVDWLFNVEMLIVGCITCSRM